MKQQALALAAGQSSGFENHGMLTRRDEFLKTMESIVPWAALCEVIEPHYPKGATDSRPLAWSVCCASTSSSTGSTSPTCRSRKRCTTAPLRRFVRIDLGRESVPDSTTILKSHRLLNEHKIVEAPFAKVVGELQVRGFKVKTGTFADATIIGTPSSTKNADKAGDPEMNQTRKGKQWYYRVKLHIGVDSQSGLADSSWPRRPTCTTNIRCPIFCMAMRTGCTVTRPKLGARGSWHGCGHENDTRGKRPSNKPGRPKAELLIDLSARNCAMIRPCRRFDGSFSAQP